MFKVHHFNTYRYGGAANAALRIHRGLQRVGVDSTFFYRLDERTTEQAESLRQVQFQPNDVRGLFAPIQKRKEKNRVREIHRLYDTHIANRCAEDFEVYSMAALPEKTRLNWNQHRADLVHLHWTAHMIDYRSFFNSIPNDVPIVWTLHDQNPFTGGCHYTSECNRFRTGCGSCPQIVNLDSKDVSHHSFAAKRNALKQKRIHVVAPGQWMLDQAQQSPIWPTGTEFSVIHYGLDLNLFSPTNQEDAKLELGLDHRKTVIGFGAEDLNNQRKGFGLLCDSLRLLKEPKKVVLAVFGGGQVPEDIKQRFEVVEFGFISDVNQLVTIYAACDFVVVPSLEDNQPQVGLEAMACGRPVIGFNATGIPEYVEDGVTGLLATAGNIDHLSNLIKELIESLEECRVMGQRARKKLETEFEAVTQSKSYARLYENFVNSTERMVA